MGGGSRGFKPASRKIHNFSGTDSPGPTLHQQNNTKATTNRYLKQNPVTSSRTEGAGSELRVMGCSGMCVVCPTQAEVAVVER